MAGAGPSEQATAGEAGRAVVEPGCSRDGECSNGLACDGEERCNDGSCEPGEPIVCPHAALHCEEDAAERCAFDTPSPWLVVGRGETLEGLPTTEIGKQIERGEPISLINLATRPPSRSLGFAGAMVGTSGPFALAAAVEEEFLLSAQSFRFGPGLPSELQLVPDVPDVLDTLDEPLISSDSRFAVMFDRGGFYLASLADRRQPTFLFPREPYDYYEPSFCEESGTFWRDDDTGLSIVTATAAGPESRRIEASSSAAFSWEKRFVVVETDEASKVLVTPCSIAGTNTVYEAAWSPVIGPGSQTLLLSLASGGQKLFSLADPQAQIELWSSSIELVSASFSSDGAHLVGLVDDTLHVAELNDASRPPMSLGLPAEASLVTVYPYGANGWQDLIGKNAALVWIPTEDGEGRELFWQPLNPTQARQSLLVDPDSSSVDILLSHHDFGQVFIAVQDIGLQHLKRVRLDTEEPELEELFTLGSETVAVEVAPDGSGLVVLANSELIFSDLYWAALDSDGKVSPPVLISDHTFNYAFQPWP
jgi:hypothetical protein